MAGCILDILNVGQERLVPGHWEGDLIKGKGNRTSVGTIMERTTLFTVLAKMESATAASAVNGFSHVLNRIEGTKRLSMTYDQGREMARHAELTRNTGIKYTLLTHTARGSMVLMKIPMDYLGSTCQKVKT